MAVYVFGVTASDVADAISWSGSISGTSEPSSDRLTDIIDQCAADLGVALEAAGITPSSIPTGSNLHGSLAGHLTRIASIRWIMANTRESDAFTEAGLLDWAGLMVRLRAGEYSSIGNNPAPASRVKGVFDSQALVTQLPSRSNRRGLWTKKWGFN